MELQLPKVLCSIHQVTLLHFLLHQMSHVDTFDAIGYKERVGRKIWLLWSNWIWPDLQWFYISHDTNTTYLFSLFFIKIKRPIATFIMIYSCYILLMHFLVWFRWIFVLCKAFLRRNFVLYQLSTIHSTYSNT